MFEVSGLVKVIIAIVWYTKHTLDNPARPLVGHRFSCVADSTNPTLSIKARYCAALHKLFTTATTFLLMSIQSNIFIHRPEYPLSWYTHARASSFLPLIKLLLILLHNHAYHLLGSFRLQLLTVFNAVLNDIPLSRRSYYKSNNKFIAATSCWISFVTYHTTLVAMTAIECFRDDTHLSTFHDY